MSYHSILTITFASILHLAALSQISCLPCDQLGMSINVGSDTNALSIYHSGQYLTHPQDYNIFAWRITDHSSNVIFQDTIVNNAFCNFSHNVPLTDTMQVEVYLVNDSAMLSDGNSIHCLFQDQIYWETGTYPSGTPWGRWAFMHGNVGTTVTHMTQIPDNSIFTLFPSPTNTVLQINGPSQPYSVSIFNMHGQLIHSANPLSGLEVLDISAYPKGVYAVCLRFGNKRQTIRFIKS